MTEINGYSPEEKMIFLEEQVQLLRSELHQLRENLWCPKCNLPRGGQLSDRDIKRLILEGRIKIDPLPNLDDPSVLGTCKIDLHLGAEALVLDATRVSHVDFSKPIPAEYFHKVDLRQVGTLYIAPNSVIVATTLERVELPDDITGRLEGKSGIARKGGSVQAAPIFDAGWSGYPMLELHNIGGVPVGAHYGVAICAMSFEHMTSEIFRGYAKRDSVRYRIQEGAKI